MRFKNYSIRFVYFSKPLEGAATIEEEVSGGLSFIVLKGICPIFLSAIYQLFIKYFNIK